MKHFKTSWGPVIENHCSKHISVFIYECIFHANFLKVPFNKHIENDIKRIFQWLLDGFLYLFHIHNAIPSDTQLLLVFYLMWTKYNYSFWCSQRAMTTRLSNNFSLVSDKILIQAVLHNDSVLCKSRGTHKFSYKSWFRPIQS